MKSANKIFKMALVLPVALTFGLALTLKAQLIYVENNEGPISVGEYTTSGTPIQTNLISAVVSPSPESAVILGGNIFIGNANGVGVFTVFGATVNREMLGEFSVPGIALLGTNLLILETGMVSEYTPYGLPVKNVFIDYGLDNPDAIAISGTNLFVANAGIGYIGEYSTDGTTIKTNLIKGLSTPTSIAISGTNLFVANAGSGTIGEYSTSGATINASLISGLDAPWGIAILGTNLFVTIEEDNTVNEYTTSGATVKAPLISGLDTPEGIVISPAPQLNIAEIGGQTVLLYPSDAANYVLQSTTNVTSTNWVTVSNSVPTMVAIITNNSPATFFRLVPPPGP